MTASGLARFYPTIAGRLSGLERAIQTAPRIVVAATMVRDMPASVLRKGRGDPLWDGGYRLGHGRYVRKDAFPAFHAADGVTTATAEVFRSPPSPGPVIGTPPTSRLLLLVSVDVPDVIDLTDETVLDSLSVARDELIQVPDWTRLDELGRPAAYDLPQSIGELAFTAGSGGILCPSARATAGKNLVVFTTNLQQVGAVLRTVNPFSGREHRLP